MAEALTFAWLDHKVTHGASYSPFYCYDTRRDMTKPTKWECIQRRLKSAWASAQSDQSLRCPNEETLGP